MNADALLLDCDGVLVDSETLSNEVLGVVAGELGIALSATDCARTFTGRRIALTKAWFEERCGRALPECWVAEVRARIDAEFVARLRPIDGAADLLRSLRLPHAVATGGPRVKTERTLELTGLRPLLRGPIFSSYDVGAWKPDPALFLHAAAALGVAPDRCTVLEDSAPGIEAGLAAGMRVLAFQPSGHAEKLPPGVVAIRTLAEVAAHVA